MKLIELNLQRIFELCKKYRVKTLAVFGSILTDRFSDQSDVDLLVNFEEDVTYQTYADNFFWLHDALRTLFGREVDLVDESAVKNRYFKEELDETRKLIISYGIARALEFLHKKNIIHRNLNPSNIFFDQDFIPYLSFSNNDSNETDIYSFGKIIYSLFEKKN